jgi:RHS repeat-associated protein
LDRPTSKNIAPRKLSAADLALFGSGTEVFGYDGSSGNATGRLTTWGAYAPSATSPMLASYPTWNAQGQPQLTYHAINGVSGSASLQRAFNRFYYAGGAMASAYYADSVGAGTTNTYSQIFLDAKGLPLEIELVNALYNPTTPFSYLVNARNVAGLVTKQQPVPGGNGGNVPTLESDWTYDRLGRVTSQHVLMGTGNTLTAGQDLSYFGNDDPKTLDQYLPTGHKQFSFGFDLRHQVTSAIENTTSGSYFAANYAFGAAGRFTHATESTSLPTGSDVKPRNVGYQYADGTAGLDPEEVIGLTSSDGSTYAQYEYDAVGNMIYRCEGRIANHNAHSHNDHAPDICVGNSVHFDYDGKDQLRRAIAMTNNAVTGTELYWYDGNGRRMVTVKLDNHGNKTEMIWWIGDTEAHYDATSTVTHIFSYLTMGGAVARVDRTADTTTNIEYEFHGLGNNTLAAVDQAGGTVNASFSYAPFGEIIEATDSNGGEGVAAHRRRFNDKFQDEGTGLEYYGFRYYDAALIGWTQADPVYRFFPDGRLTAPRRGNLYAFSLNDPLRYTDPDGRDPKAPTAHSPTPCYDTTQGCTLDVGLGDNYGAQQTGTEEAHEVVTAVQANQGAIVVQQSLESSPNLTTMSDPATTGGTHTVGSVDWNSSQGKAFAKTLFDVLSKSPSVRGLVRAMLSSGHTTHIVLSRGKNASQPWRRGGDLGASNGAGTDALILFNPNLTFEHNILVSHAPPDFLQEVKETADSALAHELFHAYEIVTGRWTGGDWREYRAVKFEDVYRSDTHQPLRESIFGECCDRFERHTIDSTTHLDPDR